MAFLLLGQTLMTEAVAGSVFKAQTFPAERLLPGHGQEFRQVHIDLVAFRVPHLIGYLLVLYQNRGHTLRTELVDTKGCQIAARLPALIAPGHILAFQAAKMCASQARVQSKLVETSNTDAGAQEWAHLSA